MEFPFYFTWSKQNTADFFEIQKAYNNTFITKNNHEVTELSSLTFQACFGFSNTFIIKKILHQLHTFPLAFSKLNLPLKTKTTLKLLEFLGLPGKILYTVSGAEAVENTLKIARFLKNAQVILSRKGAYHGATLGALSITDDWRVENHFRIKQYTYHIPEPHEDPEGIETEALIKKIGPKNIAAFCLEPFAIARENPFPIADLSWWEKIKELSVKYNIMLIIDEVTCGLYRTGDKLGITHYNIVPDMICMAKSISAGYVPFGALWTSEKIARHFNEEVFSFGLTNSAHPIGLAALDGVLDLLMEQSFIDNLKELEKVLKDSLQKMKSLACIKEINQKGLLAAVTVKKLPKREYFFSRGINVYMKKDKIILAPSFTFTPIELKGALEKFTHILEGVKN
jgi:taurine--2-oxoglutarate transaminase